MDGDMSNTSICNVINKESGENLTVYTEWSDLKLKVVITKADKILEGEVLKQDFSPYAETFEKSLEDFLKETQDILAGKNNDIDFVLRNEKFLWKRNKWSLGQIGVKTISENNSLSSLLSDILNKFSQTIRNLSETKEEQKNDKNTISELRACNRDLVKKKEQSDREWYKRCISMANSKKAKIRDLKKKLEKHESKKDPIFDADTQNSESETQTTISSDIRQSKRKSRPSLESDNEETIKKKKHDICVQTENLTEEFPIKEQESFASTSKTLQLPSSIGEDEETPDFLTDESECEVELKFEDDKNHDTETQGNAMTREESSEELF